MTDLAYLELKEGVFHLIERAPGITVEEIKEKTQADLFIPKHVPEMNLPNQ